MIAETSLYFSRPPADILRAGLAQLRRFHAPARMIARIEEELYCEGEFGAASELPDNVASFQPNSPEEDVS